MSIMKEEFIKQMLDLSSCKTSPEEWIAWWNENNEQLRLLINQGEYLRIKPRPHGFIWVPILGSQQGAIQYLAAHNIDHTVASIYQENYEKELNVYSKELKELEKRELNELKEKFPQLFLRYPQFSKSLKNTFSDGDIIMRGVPSEAIDQFENLTGIKMPKDLTEFFETVAQISIEGIKITFEEMYPINISNKDYYVIGEYWKEADGDLILWDFSEKSDMTKVFYYAHEQNKVKLLRKSFAELLEKEFVSYNKKQ